MRYEEDTLQQLSRAIVGAVDNPMAASWRATDWLIRCPFDNHGQTMFVLGWLGGIRSGLDLNNPQAHKAPKRRL